MSDAPLVSRFLRQSFGPDKNGVSDAELLLRFKQDGDQNAFEFLVWRHIGLVLRTARQFTRDKHLSEDVAQSVFLALARKPPTVEKHSLVTWLHVVTCRISSRAAAKFRKSLPTSTDKGDITEVEDRSLTPVGSTKAGPVHEEVARLSEKYRLPIMLCFYQGFTHTEAAERLGWPVGTVSVRIKRAKAILESRLGRRGIVTAAMLVAIAKGNTFASPALIAATMRSVSAFKSANLASVPAIVRTLANEELRSGTMFRRLSALTLLLGISVTGYAAYSPQRDDAVTTPDAVPTSRAVRAPVQRKQTEIDAKTIAEYEKRGAVYGGFVKNAKQDLLPETPFGGEEYLDFDSAIVFQPGLEAAKRGLPGFRWLSTSAEKLSSLPKIGVPFGLEIQSYHIKGAKELAALENLGYLTLSSRVLTDEGVKELAVLKNLRSLTLDSRELTDDGIKHIATLENLTSLKLCSKKLTDRSLKDLTALKNLTSLGLSSDLLTDEGIKELAAFKKITSLDLYSNQLTDAGAKKISALQNLTKLTLMSQDLTAAGVKELAALKKLTALKMDIVLTGTVAKELAGIENLTTLSWSNEMTVDGAKRLADLKKLTRLELDWDCFVEKVVTQLGTLDRLTSLVLKAEHIDDDVAKGLAGLNNLKSLRVVNPTWLTDEGVKEIAKLKKLTYLELDADDMTDEGVKEIASLENMNTLHIGSRKLTAVGIKELAALRKLTSFHLSLAHGEEWMNPISKELASFQNLTELSLYDFAITDQTAKDLTELKNLTSLTLHSMALTDEGANELAALKNLTSLWVTSPKLTPRAKITLKESLPDCSVQ